METGIFIFVAIVVALILLALRDLMLWYWKVNKQIEIQEKMLGAMMRILEELRMNNKPVEIISKPVKIKSEERLKD